MILSLTYFFNDYFMITNLEHKMAEHCENAQSHFPKAREDVMSSKSSLISH